MTSAPPVPLRPADFADLGRILETAGSLPLKTKLSADGHTIDLHSRNCDLCLKTGVPDTLIISRIFMPLPHHGLGSRVLAWLRRYALARGFTRIVVANLTTDDILGFCTKYGFHPASPVHGLSLPGLGGYGHFVLDLFPPPNDSKGPAD